MGEVGVGEVGAGEVGVGEVGVGEVGVGELGWGRGGGVLSPHPALARSIPSMASGVHSGGCSPKSFDSRRRLCWWASAGSKNTSEKK